MTDVRKGCELCNDEAYVYCPSDGAFLCGRCDERVHRANFLVARHVRVHVCPGCQIGAGKGACNVLGSLVENVDAATGYCLCSTDKEQEGDCLSSSSSSCVSSTGEDAQVGVTLSSSTVSRRKRIGKRSKNSVIAVDAKIEGILVNWCRNMGIEDIMVAQASVELLNVCLVKMPILPMRVLLAAAFWASIKVYGHIINSRATATCHVINRLEQISGVPAKLIVATETRMATCVMKHRQSREDREEGWAEC